MEKPRLYWSEIWFSRPSRYFFAIVFAARAGPYRLPLAAVMRPSGGPLGPAGIGSGSPRSVNPFPSLYGRYGPLVTVPRCPLPRCPCPSGIRCPGAPVPLACPKIPWRKANPPDGPARGPPNRYGIAARVFSRPTRSRRVERIRALPRCPLRAPCPVVLR